MNLIDLYVSLFFAASLLLSSVAGLQIAHILGFRLPMIPYNQVFAICGSVMIASFCAASLLISLNPQPVQTTHYDWEDDD